MKDGLMSVVAMAGVVAAVLVWNLSANDPYWRLFELPSVPAQAYERPETAPVVLSGGAPEFGNIDAGAMSPAADPLASASRPSIAPSIARGIPLGIPPNIVIREAETTAIPEPMIALMLPVEPAPMIGPAIERMAAYQLPHTAILGPIGFETEADLGIAFAPTPLPAPVALRDRGAVAVAEVLSGRALDPFVAPSPPAQPHIAASEFTEDALALERPGRIDVQRRLALAGFDPNGFDGDFGPRTRGAITDFQTAWGFPATGYLEAAVYADLNRRTEDAYQALRRQAAAAPSAAPKLAPIARERLVASAEVEGRCARRSDGRIIVRQSIVCDLAGFGEQFVSLGRNVLNGEGGGKDASGTRRIAARTPLAPASGSDR